MAQIVDTPKRRAFMAKLGEQGWLGITWPKEYGGYEGEGVYEYLLNEALAGRGGPQIGKGVGIIGKTLIRARQRLAEGRVPAEDPAQRGRVRGRLQRARRRVRRRVDEAQGRARARRRRLDAQRAEDVDDLGPLRRVVLGRRPHRPRQQAPAASRCSSSRSTIPASPSTASGRWATSAPTRCSSTTCSCPTTTSSARSTSGFQYISQALDLERFTMFTFSPIKQRLDLLCDYVRTADRRRRAAAGRPGRPPQIAQLATEAEVARVLGLRVVARVDEGRAADAAHDRVVGVQALRHRVLEAAGRRVDGHRRARQRSCGCRPRRRRWRVGPSRRTATP